MDFSVLRSATGFDVMIERIGRRAVVALYGELDIATRHQVLDACRTGGSDDEVVVDLGGLEFMDCRGYSAIVEARLEFPSASICNAVGQPAQLIEMIQVTEFAG